MKTQVININNALIEHYESNQRLSGHIVENRSKIRFMGRDERLNQWPNSWIELTGQILDDVDIELPKDLSISYDIEIVIKPHE